MQARATESRERVERKVNESRAAALLGLSTQKLRRLSAESGLGQPDVESGGAQLVFFFSGLYPLFPITAGGRSPDPFFPAPRHPPPAPRLPSPPPSPGPSFFPPLPWALFTPAHA